MNKLLLPNHTTKTFPKGIAYNYLCSSVQEGITCQLLKCHLLTIAVEKKATNQTCSCEGKSFKERPRLKSQLVEAQRQKELLVCYGDTTAAVARHQ